MTASIRAVRELGWDGKANRGELLLNVVRNEQAKDADRLEPKGTGVGTGSREYSVMDTQRSRRREST